MNISGVDIELNDFISGFKLNLRTQFEIRLRLSANGGLPMLDIRIELPQLTQVLQLIRGKQFTLSLNSDSFPFKIASFSYSTSGIASVTALYDDEEYLSTRKQSSHAGKAGTASIKAVRPAARILKQSSDSQTWIQAGKSDRDFIVDTLIHSDFGGESPFLYYSPVDDLIVSTYESLSANVPIVSLGQGVGDSSFTYSIESADYQTSILASTAISSVVTDLSTDNYDSVLTGNAGLPISNSGNVHPTYYQSAIDNIQNNLKLADQFHIVDITHQEKIIEPGAVVEFSMMPVFSGEDQPDFVGLPLVVASTVMTINTTRMDITLAIPRFQ